MGWLRKKLGLGPTKAELLEARLTQALAAHDSLIDKLNEIEAQNVKVEPDITIKSTGIGPTGEVKLALEWNDEFIEHLRENGYTGTDEEDLVNQWLNALMARYTRPDLMDNGLDLLDLDPTSYGPDRTP